MGNSNIPKGDPNKVVSPYIWELKEDDLAHEIGGMIFKLEGMKRIMKDQGDIDILEKSVDVLERRAREIVDKALRRLKIQEFSENLSETISSLTNVQKSIDGTEAGDSLKKDIEGLSKKLGESLEYMYSIDENTKGEQSKTVENLYSIDGSAKEISEVPVGPVMKIGGYTMDDSGLKMIINLTYVPIWIIGKHEFSSGEVIVKLSWKDDNRGGIHSRIVDFNHDAIRDMLFDSSDVFAARPSRIRDVSSYLFAFFDEYESYIPPLSDKEVEAYRKTGGLSESK